MNKTIQIIHLIIFVYVFRNGKNKQLANQVGVGKLYVDFLNKIIHLVKGYGKTVMVWGDIIAKHPEYMDEIPRDVIFLHWDYSKHPKEEKVELFSKVNQSFYLCPAVWGWNRLLPRFNLSHSNILTMVKYGVTYNALGILNTNWGDFGHLNFFSGSIPGLIQGAAYSWNEAKDHNLNDISEKIARIHYRDSDGKLIHILREIADCQL
ncbi:MAG: glycosyl hydrolase family 20, partial [archaeon]